MLLVLLRRGWRCAAEVRWRILLIEKEVIGVFMVKFLMLVIMGSEGPLLKLLLGLRDLASRAELMPFGELISSALGWGQNVSLVAPTPLRLVWDILL